MTLRYIFVVVDSVFHHEAYYFQGAKKKKKHTFRDLLNRRFLSSINETSCIRSISVPVPDAVVHELRQVESALVFLPALFMVPCCEHCGAPAVLCWFITSDCGEDCEPWRRFITQ